MAASRAAPESTCRRKPHRRNGIWPATGQQFGPISEAELAKFIELGHLQPTDLLWRGRLSRLAAGPGGVSAAQPRPAANRGRRLSAAASTRPSARPPVKGPERSRRDDYDEDPAPRGRVGRFFLILLLLVAIGAAGYAAYVYRGRVTEVVAALIALSPPPTRSRSRPQEPGPRRRSPDSAAHPRRSTRRCRPRRCGA